MKKEQGGEGEGGEGGFELIRSPLVDSGSSKYMEVTYDAPESTYSRQLQPLPSRTYFRGCRVGWKMLCMSTFQHASNTGYRIVVCLSYIFKSYNYHL